MESFTLYNPTLYEFGRGAEEKTGMLTFLMGVKKVLIVYGSKYVKTNGLLERIKMSLDSIGIEYAELPGAKPNPTDRLVYEGIRICREKHCDGLLAIGGGSVIDTAKAIAAGTPYQGDFWDFYAGKAIVEEALPIGVVLTIPAAGSEGSGNSVITSHDGKKISLRTDMSLRQSFVS